LCESNSLIAEALADVSRYAAYALCGLGITFCGCFDFCLRPEMLVAGHT